MRRALVIIAVALVGFAALVGADWATSGTISGFRRWSWHQRLVVAINTPDGIKVGSAVSDASWSMAPKWFRVGDSGGGHGDGVLSGEATVVEVAPGKFLFALLKGYSAETTIRIFAKRPLGTDHRREYIPALDRIATLRETRELPRSSYPILVTFDDVNSPATIKIVDPANLTASFGPGFFVGSIRIELTNEPATSGNIQKVLRWLSHQVGRVKTTDKKYATELTEAEKVDSTDFVRGERR